MTEFEKKTTAQLAELIAVAYSIKEYLFVIAGAVREEDDNNYIEKSNIRGILDTIAQNTERTWEALYSNEEDIDEEMDEEDRGIDGSIAKILLQHTSKKG